MENDIQEKTSEKSKIMDNIFILKTGMEKRVQRNRGTVLALIDLEKAYVRYRSHETNSKLENNAFLINATPKYCEENRTRQEKMPRSHRFFSNNTWTMIRLLLLWKMQNHGNKGGRKQAIYTILYE